MLVICNLYFRVELPDAIGKLQHVVVSKETSYTDVGKCLTGFWLRAAVAVKEKNKGEERQEKNEG